MSRIGLVFCAAICALGCDGGGNDGVDASDGMDAGRAMGVDGGGNEIDAGPVIVPDGGPLACDLDPGPPPELPGPLATACDASRGIECDGDWAGRCGAGCAASECCSPLRSEHGTAIFGCMPRHADGTCPAADIWVDEDRIEGMYSVEWRIFGDTSCSLVEGCVSEPGMRRLLRFDTWTPNTGDADLYLGVPEDHPELFEYSPCHMHYHFNSYARYFLVDSTGQPVAEGHKQAFCLLDFYRYPGTDENGAFYQCTNQGIQSQWQDVYDRDLDCQWVDVTDVEPGDYTLVIELNFEGVLNESDYTNNRAEIPVTIPGDTRQISGPHACTPGTMVDVGCSEVCGTGSCTGDPVMAVCDGTCATACATELAADDDCGPRCRGNGGACCPSTTVMCPDSGVLNVFFDSFDGTPVTCNVTVAPASP
jgi:hypothetical protein